VKVRTLSSKWSCQTIPLPMQGYRERSPPCQWRRRTSAFRVDNDGQVLGLPTVSTTQVHRMRSQISFVHSSHHCPTSPCIAFPSTRVLVECHSRQTGGGAMPLRTALGQRTRSTTFDEEQQRFLRVPMSFERLHCPTSGCQQWMIFGRG